MRVANRTKDYTQIDAMIREIIPKFLYNNGNGKLVGRCPMKLCLVSSDCFQVTISEIVRRRNNTFSKVKNIVATGKSDDDVVNGRRRNRQR